MHPLFRPSAPSLPEIAKVEFPALIEDFNQISSAGVSAGIGKVQIRTQAFLCSIRRPEVVFQITLHVHFLSDLSIM